MNVFNEHLKTSILIVIDQSNVLTFIVIDQSKTTVIDQSKIFAIDQSKISIDQLKILVENKKNKKTRSKIRFRFRNKLIYFLIDDERKKLCVSTFMKQKMF